MLIRARYLTCIAFALFLFTSGFRGAHLSAEEPAGIADAPEASSGASPANLNALLPVSGTELPVPGSVIAAQLPDDPLSIAPVHSVVDVNARAQSLQDDLAEPYHVTQSEVLSSAGTWGDFTRYLMLLPGVVWNSDMSNDVMVHGGSPAENLYVVDGIEVPNINHLALEGTTGGLTSMIDTSTIGSVDLKSGIYDTWYSSRLSSLIAIRTREHREPGGSQVEAGISGLGGFADRTLSPGIDLLVSAHRSILNWATNDIGLNGVPVYTNGVARLHWTPGSKDDVTVLSLSGGDSMKVTPDPCDPGVTLTVQTQYSGFRSTNGLVWRHLFGPASFSTLIASYSTQNQDIHQQQQDSRWGIPWAACKKEVHPVTPLYLEQTHDGISTLNYGVQVDRWGWLFSAGITGRLKHLNYDVAQPLGQQSPLNPNATWTDADSFKRNFLTGETAAYVQATGRLGKRWTLMAGGRGETFALGGTQLFEPRAATAFRINRRQALNASYGRSGQLAPTIDTLSRAENERLKPIRTEQLSVGMELWRSDMATLEVEAYRKRYWDEPESTEYPSLMLANMVDSFGQQFVWLPLKSGGRGEAKGVDLMMRSHWKNHMQLLASGSYSRTRYSAADGVMRAGNFDFPLVGNVMGTFSLTRNLQLALRNTYASGRPYTPFNVSLSEAQSRGIYDLSRVNAMRGPAYNRLDADLSQDLHFGGGVLTIYGGVENAFERQNFLGYAWMDSCRAPWGTKCGYTVNGIPGVPAAKVLQMPRFPSAGARYSFGRGTEKKEKRRHSR